MLVLHINWEYEVDEDEGLVTGTSYPDRRNKIVLGIAVDILAPLVQETGSGRRAFSSMGTMARSLMLSLTLRISVTSPSAAPRRRAKSKPTIMIPTRIQVPALWVLSSPPAAAGPKSGALMPNAA